MASYFRFFPVNLRRLIVVKTRMILNRKRKRSSKDENKKMFLRRTDIIVFSGFAWPFREYFNQLGSCQNNKKDDSWSTEKHVSKYIEMAEEAIKKGDIKKAEHLLNAALNVSDKIQTVGVTCAYDMLATLAFRQGNIAKAEDILVEVIQKFNDLGLPPDHDSIISFSLKLARIYQKMGENSLAEMGYRNCLTLQKEKYNKGNKDEDSLKLWINTLFWYGKFLANSQRFTEAKQCFLSAYNLCAQTKTIDTNQVMVMLFNLGEMSFVAGENEEALKYLLNAVVLGRAINSPDLATYYSKIGLVYLHKGMLEEAQKWCETARSSSRRMLDKDIKEESEDCLKEIKKLKLTKPQNPKV